MQCKSFHWLSHHGMSHYTMLYKYGISVRVIFWFEFIFILVQFSIVLSRYFDILVKVSVKENEVPTEKNSSRASIFATGKGKLKLKDQITIKKILFHRISKGALKVFCSRTRRYRVYFWSSSPFAIKDLKRRVRKFAYVSY